MPNRERDLEACEREPIHIPGSIQAHGLLLVIDPATDVILQAAGDAARLFGVSGSLIGSGMREILGISLFAMLDRAETGLLDEPTFLATVKPSLLHEEMMVTAHQVNGVTIVEIEPALETTATPKAFARIRSLTERIGGASDLLDGCRIAASEIRSITDYDRIMIYQFLPDGSGSVIAEEKRADLPSFLNHRYPASDIPKQARDLYKRNPIRVIPDVNYKPAPLVPALCPVTGEPLDMSHSSLRSISPVHIQYLKNMGVGASMSISLLRINELWGLIACHNTTARLVSFEAREMCRHVGQILSQQIRAREDESNHRRVLELAMAREEMLHTLKEADNPVTILLDHGPKLEAIAKCDGAAIFWKGALVLTGYTPSEAQVRKLSTWLIDQSNRSDSIVTDCLSEHYADAKAFTAQASGLLSIVLPSDDPVVITWFRVEQIEEIKWAGNPHEPLNGRSSASALAPRKSFATWEETVWGRSRPWEPMDIESAKLFQSRATFIIQQRQVGHLNNLLQEANQRLSALAATDGLTGIANRRTFNERMEGELARAYRDGKSIAVLILDVDFFKDYNDKFGHGAGDECLKQVARVIRSGRRGADLPARLGGEEFGLLLPDMDLKGGMAIAEMIRFQIESLHAERPLSISGSVTATIGVSAMIPNSSTIVRDLLEAADKALYRGKRSGRNRVVGASLGESPANTKGSFGE